MREALSVIIREMLNVIRSGCEGSVPVVRKTGKASFRAPAKNLLPWWGKPSNLIKVTDLSRRGMQPSSIRQNS